jgi:outer membrane receptor protein involved in Fe transport
MGLLAAACGFPAAAHAEDAPATGSGDQADAVKEVIVTAEKRAEKIGAAPVAVTVLNGEALSEYGETHLTDYYSSIPGLSISPTAFGSFNLGLRGISNAGANPTVGIVVDDVPYGGTTIYTGSQFVPDLDPGVIKNIEVLSGPQGTLYGANSMGGLIKITTTDPSTSGYSARMQAGVDTVYNGAEPGYEVRGSANIPINQTLALQVSAFARQDAGYIDNPRYNEKGVNETEVHGFRLAGLWRPFSSLAVRFSATTQSSKSNGLSEVDMAPGLHGLEQDDIPGAGKSKYDFQSYSVNVNYNFLGMNLTSITGYSIEHTPRSTDYSSTFFGSAIQAAYGVTGALFDFNIDNKRFTQEIRLSGVAFGRLDWVIGGYYSGESDNRSYPIYAEDAQTGKVGTLFFNYIYSTPPTFRESAVFGNLTLHLTNKFDIQIGGRESYDHLTVPSFIEIFGSSNTPYAAQYANSQTFNYLVTPRYRITPELMVYGRFASGFRPGAPNSVLPGIPASSIPDQSNSYEIGVKGSLYTHKLNFTGDVYYIGWKNIQLENIQASTGIAYNANGGAARSEGVEATVEARPTTDIELIGRATYNFAILTQAFGPTATAFGVSGNRLPNTSPFSAYVAGEKQFPIPGEARGFVGGSVSYIGESLGIFQPTPSRQIFPAYTKLDLRAGINIRSWSATLYVNNVTDKRGLVGGGMDNTPSNAFVYIQPQTIGFTVAKTF